MLYFGFFNIENLVAYDARGYDADVRYAMYVGATYRVINLKSDYLFSTLEADGGPAQALISNILAYFENFTIARHIFIKYIFLKTAS